MALTENLTGRVFGRWTVEGQVKSTSETRWNCICECGTRRIVGRQSLVKGLSKSCGCWNREVIQSRLAKQENEMIGAKFGWLTVASLSVKRRTSSRARYWDCVCDCGKATIVETHSLTSGHTVSCGCQKRRSHRARFEALMPMEGKSFGFLTVGKLIQDDPRPGRYWECTCACGNKVAVETGRLNEGSQISCGCSRQAIAYSYSSRFFLHGECSSEFQKPNKTTKASPEYLVYQGMKARCLRKTHHSYHLYGGRVNNPVTICDRWLEPAPYGFSNFLEDMGRRPSPEYTLDRVDGEKGYSPENCRWATWFEQTNNRSCCVYLIFNGQVKTISEWSRIINRKPHTIRRRIEKGTPPLKEITEEILLPIKGTDLKAYLSSLSI